MDAIENSYQTLLIITQAYVRSGWTRYEYQLAQEEMINRQHKVIPIFLEDPAHVRIEDKNLRHMLKSVTYLIWPTSLRNDKIEKFWDNLRKTIQKTITEADTSLNPVNSAARGLQQTAI